MLLNIDPIQPGAAASPNLWNSRFSQIAEVVNNIDSDNLKDGSVTASKISTDAFNALYPVGSVYINATVSTNPGSLLGFGTWEAFGTGRVLVGYDGSQTEFNAAEKTGGSKELQSHNHTGSTNTGGSHTHTYSAWRQNTYPSGGIIDYGGGYGNPPISTGNTSSSGSHSHSFTTGNTGSGNSGNLQPFITVYIWKRTA